MSWVEEEFETINLGDKRLNKRVIHITETLGLAPGRTIPQSFKTWAEIKACYNLFNNDLISYEKLLAPHVEKTLERIREHPVILLLSDTTDANYTTKIAMEGKERLDNKQNGLWIHSTIAVSPERLTLGIIDVNYWHRQKEVAEKDSKSRNTRDKAPIEEKESYRWLKSYLKACEIVQKSPETQIVNITDREGDIIEIFEASVNQAKQGNAAYFIIRSQYDRLLEEKNEATNKIKKKLRQKLKEEASLGEVEFIIPSTEKRKGRKVKQQIKAVTVTLTPAHKGAKKIKVNAVMALEENPPKEEEPLMWILITNLAVNNFDDVCKIIKYYLCRWEIELFYKVLKSGCKIEERQLQTANRMQILIVILMILAWRVIYTMMLGRVCSEMSVNEVFEEAEWKAVYKIVNGKKALPRKPPKLGDFIVMVAILGGYIDQKGAEPPGVKTMWKGMARMVDFAIAWEAFRK